MNSRPVQRPASITIPIMMVLFFGGGVAGIALAKAIAPQSAVGVVAGFLMLPAAFIAGFYTWLGIALFDALVKFVRRGRPRAAPSAATGPPAPALAVPPGSLGFLFTSLLISLMVGLVLAFLSTKMASSMALAAVVLAGTGYGMLCWILARSGYLPFPEGD
jgi:hypothetical protein